MPFVRTLWGSSLYLAIIVVVVLFGVGTSLYYAPPTNPPIPLAPAPIAKPVSTMRDMGVGTDDELMGDEATVTISDEKLEKLLLDKGVGEITVGRGKGKAKKVEREIYVDRI